MQCMQTSNLEISCMHGMRFLAWLWFPTAGFTWTKSWDFTHQRAHGCTPPSKEEECDSKPGVYHSKELCSLLHARNTDAFVETFKVAGWLAFKVARLAVFPIEASCVNPHSVVL